MKIERLDKIPLLPCSAKLHIIHEINMILSGSIPAIRINTTNSHRSTIKQAVAHAESRSGVDLETTISFRHNRRDGDATDAGTPTNKRLIDAYVWKKEIVE